MRSGMKPERAIRAALIEPLTDDPDIRAGLLRVAEVTLG
ncbi:CbbQ/NirQ/NorQ C-terminal domain-containing protein [Acinetobacter baumannii]